MNHAPSCMNGILKYSWFLMNFDNMLRLCPLLCVIVHVGRCVNKATYAPVYVNIHGSACAVA
jgi:hypothetical protein